jgi:hypothetical protein
VSPQGSDLVLAAHVPNVELGVLVGHGFDVESHGWDRRDVLVELELVEDCYNSVRQQSLSCSACVVVVGRLEAVIGVHALVLPAASSPSISSRISFEPKMRFIIFDIWPPMMAVVEVVGRSGEYEPCSIELVGWAQDRARGGGRGGDDGAEVIWGATAILWVARGFWRSGMCECVCGQFTAVMSVVMFLEVLREVKRVDSPGSESETGSPPNTSQAERGPRFV